MHGVAGTGADRPEEPVIRASQRVPGKVYLSSWSTRVAVYWTSGASRMQVPFNGYPLGRSELVIGGILLFGGFLSVRGDGEQASFKCQICSAVGSLGSQSGQPE
jgi:hypothetical protein